MQLKVPDFGLIVLVGAAGSGKSTLAARSFRPTEVLSSDHYRDVVGDGERSGRTTKAAFEIVAAIAGKRLEQRRLTVIDATNVHRDDRRQWVELARTHHAPLHAIILNPGRGACLAQNAGRENPRPPHVVERQWRALRRSLKTLGREGYRYAQELHEPGEIAAARIEREPLACDLRSEQGPFDIIGDVHGCRTELDRLLGELGYEVAADESAGRWRVKPPAGRRAIFVGDLTDRGPRNLDTLRLVLDMIEDGVALAVPGNHDVKLAKALAGKKVETGNGLAETLAELEPADAAFRDRVRERIERLPSHCWLDDGNLVVAHGGLSEPLQGRTSHVVRGFALYGDTTGERDAEGLPVRRDWGKAYRGQAAVVYGHTPVGRPEWVNNTICIDTGCAFGGRLTALRYPERVVVGVDAERAYVSPAPASMRAAAAGGPNAQQSADASLDLDDVTGKLHVSTRLMGGIRVARENTAAALEVMARFAVDPRWLIYLPPTMAPCGAAEEGDVLEHPKAGLDHFRKRGVERVVCEEKHMGSRAVVVVSRSREAARRRFGIDAANAGVIYTRTSRRFFDDPATESEVLDRFRAAIGGAGWWEELGTDWACLDTEVMPWSAKGAELIDRHYASVAGAARMGLAEAERALETAAGRAAGHEELLAQARARKSAAERYAEAYRVYNWPVKRVEDLKIAPFHLLATEGGVHCDKDHEWHMKRAADLARHDSVIVPTEHRIVDLADETAVAEVTAWWTERTAAGGEGMVVKPYSFITQGNRGMVTPAVKVRGAEYLRIIYGPEYRFEANLRQLRRRNTGAKSALALREFALGIEALEQFVAHAPLRRVHQAAFAVLGLEAEPVDPRL